ncbi:hypothetical protein B0920_02055 [Massilia sp. KIM]|uniref:hypothetical protein n=1 Tax=Massilia sp. KIM TaxID=1955422 RepID=UPI00098F886B|nr:hypothetical protein [Massilia sp. KIM]OON62284.1 hypothetical protein B0920_02055 [Massilia sp. KIM]
MNDNDKTEVNEPAPIAVQDLIHCPDWGKGGEYVYDPATKTRTRVEAPAGDDATLAATVEPASEAAPATVEASETTTRKERTRA